VWCCKRLSRYHLTWYCVVHDLERKYMLYELVPTPHLTDGVGVGGWVHVVEPATLASKGQAAAAAAARQQPKQHTRSTKTTLHGGYNFHRSQSEGKCHNEFKIIVPRSMMAANKCLIENSKIRNLRDYQSEACKQAEALLQSL
jgi:hypothetical protein